MLMDLRAVLGELDGGKPIRRATAAATEEGGGVRVARPGARSRATREGAAQGPDRRAAGLAEGVAATVRRMQREREPRVLVYDETGYARLVQPEGAATSACSRSPSGWFSSSTRRMRA